MHCIKIIASLQLHF